MAAPATKPDFNVIELMRVSTDLQDVARQRSDLTRLRQRFNLKAIRTLELVGLSGTATLDDRQVQQVLADLKKPGIGGIAVSSLDRLFRPGKRFGQFAIVDYFMDERKVIFSQREGLVDPNTDEGYDKIIQAGGRAGAEWRQLKQRSRDGKAEKIAQGRIVNSAAVYGYCYVPKHAWNARTCANHPQREIDPEKCGQFFEFGEQAKLDVVRSVYAERALSTPVYRIAKRLNQAGIPSAKGGLWSRQTILQMLERTEYNGRYIFNGVEIPCPKLIHDELWNKCQEVRANGKTQWIGRPSEMYLLRGYMWCRKCGHRHIGVRSGDRRRGFYRCGNRTNHPPLKYVCDARSLVRQDIIEPAAFRAIWEVLRSPGLLIQLARAYYDAMMRPEADAIEKLTQEATRLAEDEKQVIEMTRRRMYTVTEGEIELKKIRDRVAEIKAELKVAGQVVTLPPEHAIEATLRQITEGPMPKTYRGQRDVLEGLLDLRLEYEDGELEITGKVPVFDPMESTCSGEKKCNRGIDRDYISFQPIPFKINRRVA